MRIPRRVQQIELPQFDVLNDLAAGLAAGGADIINLGQALPGFPPPTAAIDALRCALDDPAAHVYSADAGLPELRRALARSLSALGASVDPDAEIIITAGGNQAFQLALTTLIDPGDEVILAAPYFLNHEMAVRSVSAIPIEAPTAAARAFRATWDDIAPWVTDRTRAVVLVSPSNPTGALVEPASLRRIAAECAARQLLLVVDETYLRLTYDTDPHTAASLADWQSHVVIVGSFSKSLAITGWRCGYLLAHSRVIGEALKVQDCMVICAPVPVQRAVTAALDAEPEYSARWLPELRVRRDTLIERLRAISGAEVVTPGGGFFVMVRFRATADSRVSAHRLIAEQHVVTIPGAFFGKTGEGYLRISYGAVASDRLLAACDRIAAFAGGVE